VQPLIEERLREPSSSRYIKSKNALIAPMSSCTRASDVGGPKSA
jgi:hypothetical protein